MKRKHREGGGKKEGSAIDDREKEEEEEEKINTFYNLVRNIREVHTQMLMGSGESKENRKEKQKQEPTKSTWTPSFTWEDFAEDEQSRSESNANSSKTNENPKIGEKRQDFDLNRPV
ncbi:uncharacterized protein LOC119982816 [Tripterygium wilfordii]|uniref:uncharacterized protein LOC119982816 n=1 Tax=Tripterygium wilfordii TaxID=458696 RepID=UPI0018F80BA4|nr:uncharacterized protein LOC119982816 [Tripterygium wilfordii]